MKNRQQQNPPPPSAPQLDQQPTPESPDAAPSISAELPPDLAALGAEADRAGEAPAEPSPAGPTKQDVPTADFLAGMLAPAFDQLAPNWKVKQHEVQMLAVGWGAVLDHYFPGGVNAWGPWGVALAATAAVLGPRINVPPRIVVEKKPDATEAQP